MDADESDAELLTKYARERSEGAFAQIVRRHAGLVHGVAVRVLQDDALARDVGQEIFVRMAKFASGIDGQALPAWLHKTTYRAALNVVRTESRRRRREERSVNDARFQCVHPELNLPDHWDEATEHLDAALFHLRSSDRRALLARFYEKKPFSEIALAVGKSENAARMQVTRALEKVSNFLKRRGVCIPAVAIAAGVSVEFSRAAQGQALAAYLAIEGASVAATNSGPLFSILFAMTNTTKITIATTLAVVACGSAYFGLLHSKQVEDNPAPEANASVTIANRGMPPSSQSSRGSDRDSGVIDYSTWKKLSRSILMLGVDMESTSLMNDVVELLKIDSTEREKIDRLLGEAMFALKSLEKENAKRVEDERGESILIDPFDGSGVESDLSDAIEVALTGERGKILSEIVGKSSVFNNFGKFPTSLYFEENAEGESRFHLLASRPNIQPLMPENQEPGTPVITYAPMKFHSIVSSNDPRYWRFEHVFDYLLPDG